MEWIRDSAYLEEQWVFHKPLHRLQEKPIKGIEITSDRVFRTLDLIEHLTGQLSSLPLVCDERLITRRECIFVRDEWVAPFLPCFRHRICCFHPDQELALAIKDRVDVEEDVVDHIARDDAILFEGFFQVVQVLQILDVFPLRVYQLTHNIVAVAHLEARLHEIVLGIGLDL